LRTSALLAPGETATIEIVVSVGNVIIQAATGIPAASECALVALAFLLAVVAMKRAASL